ncbi:MAG: hypothetical protein ACOZCO_01440 [Bacteroidota bacterium]
MENKKIHWLGKPSKSKLIFRSSEWILTPFSIYSSIIFLVFFYILVFVFETPLVVKIVGLALLYQPFNLLFLRFYIDYRRRKRMLYEFKEGKLRCYYSEKLAWEIDLNDVKFITIITQKNSRKKDDSQIKSVIFTIDKNEFVPKILYSNNINRKNIKGVFDLIENSDELVNSIKQFGFNGEIKYQ